MSGMSAKQKDRLSSLLDNFKKKNGGCLLCGKKIEEYSCVPSEFAGRLELHMYGACHGHTVLVESEAKMESEVVRLREEYKPKMENPRLLTVIYGPGDEEVKYA